MNLYLTGKVRSGNSEYTDLKERKERHLQMLTNITAIKTYRAIVRYWWHLKKIHRQRKGEMNEHYNNNLH